MKKKSIICQDEKIKKMLKITLFQKSHNYKLCTFFFILTDYAIFLWTSIFEKSGLKKSNSVKMDFFQHCRIYLFKKKYTHFRTFSNKYESKMRVLLCVMFCQDGVFGWCYDSYKRVRRCGLVSVHSLLYSAYIYYMFLLMCRV